MSKKFIKKNIKLSLEFDKYISSRPQFLQKIPSGAWVVFTVKGDKEFNENSMSLIKKPRIRKKKIVEVRKEGNRWKIQEPYIFVSA